MGKRKDETINTQNKRERSKKKSLKKIDDKREREYDSACWVCWLVVCDDNKTDERSAAA